MKTTSNVGLVVMEPYTLTTKANMFFLIKSHKIVTQKIKSPYTENEGRLWRGKEKDWSDSL